MYCGIGRDKSNKDCEKPYKHPATSPLTVGKQVEKQADKKASSRASVSPMSFDKIYDEAVKQMDVKSKSEKLADKHGLVSVGKIPGKARGLPAYKTKKAGKRRRKKRKTRKRRKTKRKRKRKKRRKSKRRK